MRRCEPMVLIARGKRETDSIHRRLLEEQRLAAPGRFHLPIRHSVISSSVATGSGMRFSSPLRLQRTEKRREKKR